MRPSQTRFGSPRLADAYQVVSAVRQRAGAMLAPAHVAQFLPNVRQVGVRQAQRVFGPTIGASVCAARHGACGDRCMDA